MCALLPYADSLTDSLLEEIVALDSRDNDATAAGSTPKHEAPRGSISDMSAEERAAAIAASIPKAAAPKHEAVKAALAVDGEWGAATTSALQVILGVAVDGVFGPASAAALQSKLGVEADGDFGPNSARALQSYLAVEADGDIGPATVSAMQSRLNAGTF